MIFASLAAPTALSAARLFASAIGLTAPATAPGGAAANSSAGSGNSTAASAVSGGPTGTPSLVSPIDKTADVVNQGDFMKLLIAQLQNQDPLNPLDSANFSAQLAQFSSLDQLTQINQHLADQSKAGSAGPFEAVSFIGRQVRGTSGDIAVKNGVATGLDYTLAAAGPVQAQIIDANGQEVARILLKSQSAGAQHLDLAQVADAPHLADGVYTVQLTQSDATGNATPVKTTMSGLVTGVDLSTSPPTLLIGDQRVALADILEVRQSVTTGTS